MVSDLFDTIVTIHELKYHITHITGSFYAFKFKIAIGREC